MPDLSVIMPAYNAVAHISQAIRSTLNALPRDSELVVLDDGSTDETADAIDQFEDKRLRVIRRTVRSGVAGGLNALLAATDSRLVARMDADDVCLANRFAMQLAQFDAADVTFSNVMNIDDKGRPLRPSIGGSLDAQTLPIHLLLGNMLVHPTMLAKREHLMRGYRDSAAEDYEMWLSMIGSGYRLQRTRQPAIAYRRHSSQTSLDSDWLSRVEREAHQNSDLWESYARAYSQIVGSVPEREDLLFAMRSPGSRGNILAIARTASRLPLQKQGPFWLRFASAARRSWTGAYKKMRAAH